MPLWQAALQPSVSHFNWGRCTEITLNQHVGFGGERKTGVPGEKHVGAA